MSERPDEQLDLAGCARLLGLSRRRVAGLVRRGSFPSPAGEGAGGAYWHKRVVFEWAVKTAPELSSHVPVTYWPDGSEPADYVGCRVFEDRAMAMGWRTSFGLTWLLWQVPHRPELGFVQAVGHLGNASAIVEVQANFSRGTEKEV